MATISEALGRHFLRPFRWGETDCCAAACSAFRDVHGVDPMASIRGAYSDRRGAERVISEAGGLMQLAVRLAGEAGLAGVASAAMRAGDIALIDTLDGPALGLVVGRERVAQKSLRGFAVVSSPRYVWGVR